MRYLAKFGGMVFLFLQKLLPIKKDRVVFTSFGGHYSDNPKYISQKLHELYPALEIVWLVKPAYLPLLPDYVKAVNIDNKWAVRWYTATARALVDNVYGGKESRLVSNGDAATRLFKLYTWLKTKKDQQVFTTWHGTPLKCMGRDQIGSNELDFSCPNTTMMLGNRYTLDIMQHLTFDKIRMELLGTPRNDLLFSGADTRAHLKAELGFPADKKIVLFAPTFRSDGNIQNKNVRRSGLDQLEAMAFQRLFSTLSERFGGDWVLVCRFHYHVENLVDWGALEAAFPGRIINGNAHDDMALYLAAADLLLTDASSAMYDFSLTGRPCLLFFPDLEHYATQERGFYVPIDSLPFPVADTFDGLLRQIAVFDETDYDTKVRQMHESYGYADDADSSERVANYIFARL